MEERKRKVKIKGIAHTVLLLRICTYPFVCLRQRRSYPITTVCHTCEKGQFLLAFFDGLDYYAFITPFFRIKLAYKAPSPVAITA